MYCMKCVHFKLIGNVVGICSKQDKTTCTYDNCKDYSTHIEQQTQKTYQLIVGEGDYAKYDFDTEEEALELVRCIYKIDKGKRFIGFTYDIEGNVTRLYAEYECLNEYICKINTTYNFTTIGKLQR